MCCPSFLFRKNKGGTAASRADEKWEQELWEDAAAAEEEELRKEKERTKREEREEQEEERERNEEEQERRRRKEEEERPSWRKRVLYWSPLPIFGLFTGNELKRVLGDKNPEHPFAHWEVKEME